MSSPTVFVLSLALALAVNAIVAAGAAVAALGVSPIRQGPTNIVVSASTLRPEDLGAITSRVSGQATVTPIASRALSVNVSGQTSTVTVEGVQPNFEQLASWRLDQGRFFTSEDETSLSAVAVLSPSLHAAVGQAIRIGDRPFTVVGIGEPPQARNVVLLPFRTAQIRLFGRNALDEIVLQVSTPAEATSVTDQVEALLRTRHNLHADQSDDFAISDAPIGAASPPVVTGSRVLQVIQQFACSAKNTCPRRVVS